MPVKIYWNKKTGDVLVPTVAKTEAGFWIEVEPVERASLNDVSSVSAAIRNAFGRVEIVVPTPTRSAFPKPVVLRHANVDSWISFEKQYSQVSIVQDPDGHYMIEAYRRALGGIGVEVDLDRTKLFSESLSLDGVIEELISSMQGSL